MPDESDQEHMKLAVLVSGNGTNLQALIDAEKKDELAGARIALVISDNAGAPALKRAGKAGIKTVIMENDKAASREEYDNGIIKELKEEKIDLVVLAGFMRILSGAFVDEYYGKMMNIHPALLPAFRGAHGIKDAFDYGVKVTGVTVHFVNKELDGGPVILQECVKVEEGDTMEALEERIHKAEHKLYAEAVRLFAKGKLKIEGRKVKII